MEGVEPSTYFIINDFGINIFVIRGALTPNHSITAKELQLNEYLLRLSILEI